jgi:hypothetical protein
LGSPGEYKQALNHAGFKVSAENNRRDFAVNLFQQMRAKSKANGGPPPLGLHTLMPEYAQIKVKNMIDSIVEDLIAPVEIITQK